MVKEHGVPAERILHVAGALEAEGTPKMIVEKTIARFERIDILVFYLLFSTYLTTN